MSPLLVFSVIASYFFLLVLISRLTGRNSNAASFFTANKKSPWYLVAFGMIGASLSGVTFISVPGWVADTKFYYFQMVLGYLLGYFVIAIFLMPLYYKLNLVTIYSYLKERLGTRSYKTGAAFFLLSRVAGASFRLFLVAGVLQLGFFDAFNIPFQVTVFVTVLLIWLYTYRSGIKTIVWTDTLQTFFMLSAVVMTVIIIGDKLNLDLKGVLSVIKNSDYSSIFDWNMQSRTNFFKQFIAGAFIAVVMTGLDQDMMQKNLTCRNIKEARKNMFWFSITLIPVNLLFLSLGALLYYYAAKSGIELPPESDDVFPYLALNHLPVFAGIIFLLGITAAAFSSADSALTALTTSFSIDFLNLDINKNDKKINQTKYFVHLGFSLLLFGVIVLFKMLNDDNVVSAVFKVAGYTYGPILGLFAFALLTKRKVNDRAVPFIAVIVPFLTYFINLYSEKLLFGYKFGFELLLVNGMLMFAGLLIFSEKTE
ncbi:MAG: sodium:solute symporter [Chlorobi bacterium]|nr:sodium:solute symporter [Chlorobiota bacterium]